MTEDVSNKPASLFSRLPRSLGIVLPILMIGLTVLGSIAVGVAGFSFASAGLEESGRTQLSILAETRSKTFNKAMQRSVADLETLASGAAAKQAITDLSIMIESLPQDIPKVQAFFQEAATPEERAMQTGDGSGSMYAYRHVGFHGGVYSAWKNGGYADIYLVNADGYIVYSVTKSADFLRTLGDDGIAGSGLAKAIAASAEAEPGSVIVSDYAPYALNDDVPAMFMAEEIRGAKGDPDAIVGFVAIRLDASFFDAILNDTDGLGETGQTFLINDKGVVLSDMPRASAPTALAMTIDNADIAAAPAGDAEVEASRVGADGVSNLSVAVPVQFQGERWAVVAERAESEVMASVGAIFQAMLIATAVVIVVASILGILISRRITNRVTRLTGTMEALAGGNLDAEVRGTEGHDELGAMARAVQVFRENAKKVAELTEEQQTASEQRLAERAEMMHGLQDAFGHVVQAAIEGDFSQRVRADFPDAELTALAEAFNSLVGTVDRGVGEAGRVLSALADTNLTMRVEGDFSGAFDRLKQDTNAVADKLVEIVTQLRTTSHGLKTATGEILSGANDLSERTTKQAATIEETSAAMEQLANTVMENAKKAGTASDQAKNASRTAEEGGEVMGRANVAMERISNSSSKISNIIGMIDDIAFQTNLLALNASVEAARAGEAGKGFAVVAVEVRRLAQSAAEASADVKTLIEQSGEEVAGGTKLVAEAAEKLSSMLEAVRTNASQMEQIAKDSQEQASAIEEVNSAVRQMDEMTQHNAALVEETNAAIEQTDNQVVELDKIVEVFTLAEGTTHTAPAAKSTRPAKPAGGVKGLQQKVTNAAKTYLSKGNAAVKEDQDWSEF